MTHHLLLISGNTEDIAFWQRIAADAGAQFHLETVLPNIRAILNAHPECLVFWDAGIQESQRAIEDLLKEATRHSQVFAITDEPVNRQPELFRPPVFSHHIYRRYRDPAFNIYSKLINAALTKNPFGFERYFPEKFERKTMKLTHSLDKQKVLEQIREFLEAHEVPARIISSGLDAADELIMNAIFDAPCDQEKGYYRRGLQRTEGFDLSSREQAIVEIGFCQDFIGIKVSDNFGSLKRESILKHLGRDFQADSYTVQETDPGAGLGLQKINNLAMALLFVTQPKIRTEVMVFFGNAKSYREFRLGYFSFFSIMEREPGTTSCKELD